MKRFLETGDSVRRDRMYSNEKEILRTRHRGAIDNGRHDDLDVVGPLEWATDVDSAEKQRGLSLVGVCQHRVGWGSILNHRSLFERTAKGILVLVR